MEEVKYGLGRHNLVLLAVPGQGNFTMIMKWIWWHSHFVIIGICMVKISIGLFLLRLSSVYYRRFLISMIGTSKSLILRYCADRSKLFSWCLRLWACLHLYSYAFLLKQLGTSPSGLRHWALALRNATAMQHLLVLVYLIVVSDVPCILLSL